MEFKVALEDLGSSQYDNIGGIPCKIHYTAHDNIHLYCSLPVLSDTSTLNTVQCLVNYPVLKTGKTFKTIDIIMDKGGIVDTVQGETGGKSTKSELKFNLAGQTENNLGFARIAQNGHFSFIIPDENTGFFRGMGLTRYRWADLDTGKGGTGEGSAGWNGWEYTFKTAQSGPVPIIKLTEAQLNTLLGIE